MRIAAWEFKPSLWPTLATLLVIPLFLYLGTWQLDRAEQKRSLHHEFEIRQDLGEINFNKEAALQDRFKELHWRNVSAAGVFAKDTHVLLDNQVEHSVAGYYVYTPFRPVTQDAWVLVNRGWVPAGDSRNSLPVIETTGEILQIAGSVNSPPYTGVLLGENIVEEFGSGMFRIQKLNLNEAEEFLNLELLPYVIRMSPESPGGFARHWKVPGSGVAKHLGYAFQWFAMATVILVIYLILNIKRAE